MNVCNKNANSAYKTSSMERGTQRTELGYDLNISETFQMEALKGKEVL